MNREGRRDVEKEALKPMFFLKFYPLKDIERPSNPRKAK